MFSALTRVFRSTSFRIAALFMAIFVVSTLVIGVSFQLIVEDYLEDQARSFVEALMLDTTSFYEEFGAEGLIEEINERDRLDPYSRDIYVLFDENYEPIAGAPNRLPEKMLLPDFPQGAEAARGRVVADFPSQLHRGRSQPRRRPGGGSDDDAVVLIEELSSGWSLMIVLIAPEIEETREFVRRALAGSVILMSLLGLLGAILLTNVVGRRLERLNALSYDIREGDLSRRIPTDGTGDEFDSLAENLNAMLDRIAELLESSRQVSNDIAHDLRTPLTRMQTRVEELRGVAETGRDVDEVADQIMEDSRAVLRVFDALLRISGIESGSADSAFEEVSLSEIVEDVAELYEPLASQKAITYTQYLEPELEITGDKHLLFQAIANIVENAIKYTPGEGHVSIDLSSADGGVRLVVEDSGPGIPEDMHDKVFDRFYRLESHRGSPGNGLGLSLVKAIVDLHGGTIRLGSSAGGLRFEVEI
jgi:signal transduction histidine kinase